jgi:hypothetical protein
MAVGVAPPLPDCGRTIKPVVPAVYCARNWLRCRTSFTAQRAACLLMRSILSMFARKKIHAPKATGRVRPWQRLKYITGRQAWHQFLLINLRKLIIFYNSLI